MRIFALVVWLCMMAAPAYAQDAAVPAPAAAPPPALAPSMPEGEVLSEPLCFNVINAAPYAVHGTIVTSHYTAPDGSQARHRTNFRLGQSEKAEFCTFGPFYEGRKLELVLRTLIPVFSCKTALTGDIVIQGRQKDEGGTDTWALCL